MASRLVGLSLGKLAPTPKVSSEGDTGRTKTTEEIETEVFERLIARDKLKTTIVAKKRRLTNKSKPDDDYVKPDGAEAPAVAVPCG